MRHDAALKTRYSHPLSACYSIHAQRFHAHIQGADTGGMAVLEVSRDAWQEGKHAS